MHKLRNKIALIIERIKFRVANTHYNVDGQSDDIIQQLKNVNLGKSLFNSISFASENSDRFSANKYVHDKTKLRKLIDYKITRTSKSVIE